MTFFEYPDAAQVIGRFVRNHLDGSGLSLDEFASLSGLEGRGDVWHLMKGDFPVPFEWARPLAQALDRHEAELVYWIMRQHAPEKVVENAFEAIAESYLMKLFSQRR